MLTNTERGFSTVEMLVATLVFSVVSAGVLTMVSSVHRSFSRERHKTDLVWQGRASVDVMVRELRLAGYPARNAYVQSAGLTPLNSNLVATTFVEAAAARVAFDADLDLDGVVERVEYRLNGTTLERAAVSRNADGSVPALVYEPVIENVTNGSTPLFTYATDPYSSLTFPGNVESVRVTLVARTANPDVASRQHDPYRFEGVAHRMNPDR